MDRIKLDDKIFKKCNESTIISGSSRSGTTLLGKILHSFENVEYAYEPPMLFSLFSVMTYLDKNSWKLLYETYLYEEFLMNALAGRAINCNKADDSSIYNVKPLKLIEERLNKSFRKIEAERLAQNSHIVYKIPDIVPFLPILKKYYPGIKIIIILRDAPSVFWSIFEKGWFNDKSLKEENLIWPNRFLKGIRIPFWVDQQDAEEWVEMDELHRIAYYYIRVNQPLADIPDYIAVKYSKLVDNPEKIIKTLAERLGMLFGEKTTQLISIVSLKRKNADHAILDKLIPSIKEKVEYYSSLS